MVERPDCRNRNFQMFHCPHRQTAPFKKEEKKRKRKNAYTSCGFPILRSADGEFTHRAPSKKKNLWPDRPVSAVNDPPRVRPTRLPQKKKKGGKGGKSGPVATCPPAGKCVQCGVTIRPGLHPIQPKERNRGEGKKESGKESGQLANFCRGRCQTFLRRLGLKEKGERRREKEKGGFRFPSRVVSFAGNEVPMALCIR